MSDFQNTIYKMVRQIPPGKVATYQQIASLIGNAKASRAVGSAIARNENPQHVPCYRVVASDGSLRGYKFAYGIPSKKSLLMKEGVIFKNNKVDLKISQWKQPIN